MTNILQNSIFLGLLLFCLYILYTPQQAQAVWVYEDLFNSDTASSSQDLNGQNGWTGDTAYDVVTTDPYEGDQHVSDTDVGGNIQAGGFSGVSSGVLYVAILWGNAAGDSAFILETNSSASNWLLIQKVSTNIRVSNGAGYDTYITSFTTNQWYLFEVTIESTSSYTIRYHDGTSWSTPTASKSAVTTGSVDDIRFNSNGNGVTYFDTITDTNPIAEAAAEVQTPPPIIFIN